MTISFWDAGVIAGWMIIWFMAFALVFGILGAVVRRRRQRNEVYERLRRAVKTEDEFNRIIKTMTDGETK